MKKTKKIVALVLAAVMLVCTTVAATVAYLQDEDSVTNTFTVGEVGIELLETEVDEYGTEVTPDPTVKGNEYKLVPGHKYMKDPTIFVDDTSENCWLFAKIENGLEEDGVITMASGWTEVKDSVYVYGTECEAEDEVVVFTDFTFANDADPTDYEQASIVVTAYAIQADGFDVTKNEDITAMLQALGL